MASTSSESSDPQISKSKNTQMKPKPKKKDKDKRKQSEVGNGAAQHGRRDEAVRENTSTYEPPPGSVPFDHDVDFAEFDWDSVENDEDVELWLVRVPDSIRPKHIEHLKIEIDHPSSPSQSVRVGQLARKHAKYDVWSLGDGNKEGDSDEAGAEGIGGEELNCFTCLLPRKRKDGKLYQAPKAISRRLVLCASPPLPTSDASHTGPALLHQNPPRHSYPKQLLKHRFTPYGSVSSTAKGTDASPVDVEMTDPTSTINSKKRSRESDTPRKSKKVKGLKVASGS